MWDVSSPCGMQDKVSFRLSEDLTSLAAAGEKDASPQVPRDHPFGMHAVGGQTLLTYSQSSTVIVSGASYACVAAEWDAWDDREKQLVSEVDVDTRVALETAAAGAATPAAAAYGSSHPGAVTLQTPLNSLFYDKTVPAKKMDDSRRTLTPDKVQHVEVAHV
ncbi:General transcription factor IIF subunit 2 [Takifugu flavidus]|uniref:General transcription factor IIF subunit 2 n=1 Tax=Takifugu flavidus TaxID=433684 RepID=A0A5C6PMD9_9TELE|nr:General transcription factor IIF subunit 2 [Takifugu flavidus]